LADIGAAAVAAHAVGSRRLRFRPLAYLALLEAVAGRSARARRLAVAADAEWAGRGRPEARRSPAAAAALAWAHLDRYELEEARDRMSRVREHAIPADAAIVGPLVAVLQCRLLRVRHEYDKAEATMAALVEDRGLPRWVREQVVSEAVRTCFARGAVADGLALLDPDEDGAGWTARLRIAAGADGVVAGVPPPVDTSPDVPPIVAVENGIVRASSALAAGAVPRAVSELAHALELAAPETLRWPFLDAPPPARRLLRMHLELKARGAWLSPSAAAPRPRPATGGEPPSRPQPTPLIQELSEREREVLVHLSEMLSTAEIAATMFISVNTVRTHIRSILRKLSATRRNQAVRRARELGII
jgi:LuxR family maltose regulon positive regulatory protein